MSDEIDYLKVLRDGLTGFTRDQFKQLSADVIGWLMGKKEFDEADLFAAEGVLNDSLNILVAASGKGDVRKKILQKAETSKDPNGLILWELRKLVKQGIDRERYSKHQRRLYRQVSSAVLVMEEEGVLRSTMPMKQLEIVKSVLRLHRDGKSAKQIARLLSHGPSDAVEGKLLGEQDVASIVRMFHDPRKRIGLASWGEDWLHRKPEKRLDEAAESLSPIPMYQGEGGQDRESKILHSSDLRSFIPELITNHGASVTLGGLSKQVERKLIPPPYRPDRETLLPEMVDRGSEDSDKIPTRQILACAVESCESEVHSEDVLTKLRSLLTAEERAVFDGRCDDESVRSLAARTGCSIGTISNRIKSIREKAAPLDPVIEIVRDRLGAKVDNADEKR